MERKFINLSLLPKEEARVLIAKDVLKQLDAKKLVATEGTYLEFENVKFSDSDFLHEVLAETKCEVCALGSLYYSRVQLANETKCGVTYTWHYDDKTRYGVSRSGTIEEDLLQYFDGEDLNAIETYFEGWREASGFSEKNSDPETRMRKIMQNIVDNNGTFKPELL